MVNTRVFQRTSPVSNYGEKCESGQESIIPKQSVKLSIENVKIDKFDERCDKPPGLISNVDENNSKFTQVTSQGVENSETNVDIEDSDSSVQTSIKTKGGVSDGCVPLYDVNFVGIEDKFASSLMYSPKNHAEYIDQPIYQKWLTQSDFEFGYVPLQDQMMPVGSNQGVYTNPIDVHKKVRQTGLPNFMSARIPVESQLNIDKWKEALVDYWDQQLLQLLEYGFPLDFNRTCKLRHEGVNHNSANQFPSDIQAYISEETHYGAIIGPFDRNPIEGGHISPFMTRHKPDSDRRRVIIDLSWPVGESVNAGIDKDTYLGSQFDLRFPSVDDITEELKKLGKGALLYKVDVSRAFRHVKIDPGDYDLLGLNWNGVYLDTCLPFGTRHGSQIFQRLSDAVRYVMRRKGYRIIDYIDDYIGVALPSVASDAFDALVYVMSQFGLTISKKKLVSPSTKVVCLGVLIDSIEGTIQIPPEKLNQILSTVRQWSSRTHCSKRQLQSLLGLLLFVHKCVKPA